MKLSFDEAKATQTAGEFLRLAGGRLNYLALIKLLYMADREAVRLWGLPITTDTYCSMKFGPVTSIIYNRIKASASSAGHRTFWSAHIRTQGVEALLDVDPGFSEMSRAELKLIAEVFERTGKMDRFELVEKCHSGFPEWLDPGGSSIPLDITEIVSALGLSEEETRNVQSQIEIQRAAQSLAA